MSYRDDLEAARRRAESVERENARLRRGTVPDRVAVLAIGAIVATAALVTGLTLSRRDPEPDCRAVSWRQDAVTLEPPYGDHHVVQRVSFDEGAGRCLELRFDRPLDDARVLVVGRHRGQERPIGRERRVHGNRLRVRLDPVLDAVDVEVHRHWRARPTLVAARVGERRGR